MADMADTILNALKNPLCQCTIGYAPNGSLYCAFSAYLRGHTQIVDNGDTVNCSSVFITRSTDGGQTWVTPVNFTPDGPGTNNGPYLENKYPSLVPNANTTNPSDSIAIVYFRDMKAGDFVNVAGWGIAPGYQIFRKGLSPIGILNPGQIASKFSLQQNYPNPFNPVTTIEYSIPKNSLVTIKVYDIIGREVRTLINSNLVAGNHMVQFDARDLSSGAYFYRITAGDFTDTKKMILTK
jgi:hypothetical protein